MSHSTVNPCPLCGRIPKTSTVVKHYIFCTCGLQLSISELLTMDQAILLWNNRPGEAKKIHLLDYAAKVYEDAQYGQLFQADDLYKRYGVVTQMHDGMIRLFLEDQEVL